MTYEELNIKMRKKLDRLAPHEREVLESEYLKEELIQKRLKNAIAGDIERRGERAKRKALRTVVGVLREKGYSEEDLLK